jgi:GNAT superfamily N-acetyltransferase
MGLTAVPSGHVAAIVTTLEMRDRPPLRPIPASNLRLVAWHGPKVESYRTLFRRVGEPWLWFSRLVRSDEALLAIIGDPAVEVYAVCDAAGIEVGMLELDFRKAPDCEIAFFGLVPELNGGGHGRWLMAETMARAWRPGIQRLWVHTCTLDHPSALSFYRRQGFVAINREFETFADPRLTGALSAECAPQIPILNASVENS